MIAMRGASIDPSRRYTFVYESPGGNPMPPVRVHPRVLERHPWLDEQEVLHTWRTAWKTAPRLGCEPPETLALGWDLHGRLMELIAYTAADEVSQVIFHANIAQKKFLREMRLTEFEIHSLIGRR